MSTQESTVVDMEFSDKGSPTLAPTTIVLDAILQTTPNRPYPTGSSTEEILARYTKDGYVSPFPFGMGDVSLLQDTPSISFQKRKQLQSGREQEAKRQRADSDRGEGSHLDGEKGAIQGAAPLTRESSSLDQGDSCATTVSCPRSPTPVYVEEETDDQLPDASFLVRVPSREQGSIDASEVAEVDGEILMLREEK
jgi:hypothetical protein